MAPRSPKELEGDTQRAVQILELFTDPSKGRDVKTLIPPSVLREAHGLVLIRLYRIGFMVSAKSGTGIIIARKPDGSWSAPSGVSMSSLGFGHQAGGEIIDSIIVMNYRAAVKAFFDGGGQLQLGVGASLAAGPFGRAADVSASASSSSHIAATYAYSQSKGLYAGYSFEGSKISERVNTNKAFYGRPISAREILTGDVPPPNMAARLYQILDSIGAGARPGLPFAPKKSVNGSPNASNAVPSQQQQQQQNRPTNPQGFEEPPPPYQESESSDRASTAESTSTVPPPAVTVTTGGVEKGKGIFKPDSNDANQSGESSSFNPSLQPNTSASASSSAPRGGPVVESSFSIPPPPPQPPVSSSYSVPPPVSNSSSSSTPQPVEPQPVEPQPVEPQPAATVAPPKEEPLPASAYPKDVKHPIPNEDEHQMSVVVAIYDYEATQPTDLSFRAGDHIIVTNRVDDRQCWWEGEIGDRKGFFPANYTDDLED